MSDDTDGPPIGMAGGALLFATTPFLAYATHKHGAWWTDIVLIGLGIATVFLAVGIYQDIRSDDGDDGDGGVPDDPMEVLEDGEGE